MIGREILNYRIERLLGSGGMGSVYLAVNMHIEQKVAIKVLHTNLAESEFIRQKFVREAQTLLTLEHPNIVKFINFYENEDGVFLIMEYVDGITLDDFINHKQGLIVESKVYDLFNPVLDAFTYAHKRGIVHRDIKPSNVILTSDDEGNFVVKMMDFGIARIITESNEDESGMILGTPLYMSPEQIRGEDLDSRSDVYSLGVMLHQMLTGRSPYDATTLSERDIQHKVIVEPLPRMREYYQYISERMQKIVDRATEKNPASRYPDCITFKKDFNPKPPIPLWQKLTAVAVFLILLGGGWWFYSYNFVTKTRYYKDYVEQWGTPVGIGKADYKHREGSYRFEKQKGKIVRISHVNSRGNIVGHSDSEHTERIVNALFYYTANGKINYIEIMDKNNKILYRKDYDENLRTVTFKHADEFGAEMSLAASTTKLFANPFANSHNEKGRISRYLLTYDDNGYVKRLQYAGYQNVLVSDVDGLFGKEYIVDEKGRVIEEVFLGHDGMPKANKAGLAIKVFEYDINDDWAKVTYYSADRELSSDGNGCPVVVLDNDKWGNRIKETYYDGYGNLVLRTDIKVAGMSYERDDEGYRIVQSVFGIDGLPCYYGDYGFYSMENEYDDNGYLSKVMYKDMEGNLVAQSDGNAIRIMKNDNRGNLLEEYYFDVNHEPCEITWGYAKVKYEYDSLGNQTAVFFYDIQDSLFLTSYGYAGMRYLYNDKSMLIELTFYGEDNQPCGANDVFIIKYEYDPRGNETKRSFYAADGVTLSLNSNEGIAGWESKYDNNGNEIERIFFDVNGDRTAGYIGYASWIATYNSAGYMEELKNLNVAGQLVYVASDGYAGIKYTYDNRGNITERFPYGTNGNLIGNIERRQYDSRDNRIETAYYNQNNSPTLGPDGYFRIVSSYDNRHNIIEQQYYDIANRLFAPKSYNYAIVRYQYDNRGNTIEVAYFNESQKPVSSNYGYATYRSEYDAMGRVVRQTFFDENGSPTKPSIMVPEGLVEYDKWGNIIYLAAADGSGNLIDNPNTGWSIRRRIFDIKGNQLEESYFDKDDNPCIEKNDKVHKITYTYNMQNNPIETRYYSTPTDLRKDEFAIYRQKYDESGDLVEDTYFNWQDKPFNAWGVWHKVVYSTDAQGNRSCKIYQVNGSLYGMQRYNRLIGRWEWVDTSNTTTNTTNSSSAWREQAQTWSRACPIELDGTNYVITSISLQSNGFEMKLRYPDVSKYNISNAQLGEYQDGVRNLVDGLKKQINMPAGTRVTVIAVDRAERELYRITI